MNNKFAAAALSASLLFTAAPVWAQESSDDVVEVNTAGSLPGHSEDASAYKTKDDDWMMEEASKVKEATKKIHTAAVSILLPALEDFMIL